MAVINGNASGNILNGTLQNDLIRGFGGDDTLNGSGGNDRLLGGSGQDIYNGGDGNDQFILQDGETILSETYSGGSGGDTLKINGTVNFRTLTLDTLASVERIDMNFGFLHGTSGDDIINLSGVRRFLNFTNNIDLGDGNDSFFGSRTNDRVNGGDGNDVLRGGAGDDVLRGGQGQDSYFGGSGNDRFALLNNEIVSGETYKGGSGTDTLEINGTAIAKKLVLKASNSVEVIDFGFGFLEGTTGRDIVNISGVTSFTNFSNNIDLGEGNDVFRGSNTLNDRVNGGDGNDTLYGNGGNDKLRGGLGTDHLIGGTGDDEFILLNNEVIDGEIYDGGAGNDKLEIGGHTVFFKNLDLTSATSVEEIDFGFGFFRGTAGADTVDISGVTNFTNFSNNISLGDGNDTFRGSDTLNDRVNGDDGNDTLYGNGGNDKLRGGLGTDHLIGGAGDDDFILLNNEVIDSEIYEGGAGNDKLDLNGGTVYFTNLDLTAATSVEEIDFGFGFFLGTTGDDTVDISGVTKFTNFSNIINLGDGNDIFEGSDALNDRVNGGDGNDLLLGHGGNDKLRGGLGTDSYQGGAGDDDFILTNKEVVDGETYNGATGTDTLDLNGGTVYFKNLDLSAGTSVEEIDFGFGFFLGTDGNDTVNISGVSVFTNFSNNIDLGDGNDIFRGSETRNDRVNGGDGNDTLIGNGGNDVLRGGIGDDTFVYNSGSDRIADFSNGANELHLDDALWAGNLTKAQVLAFASVVSGDTIFDFGNGNTLELSNYTDIAGLESVLTIV
jgi:Ca2+-binding RTX toxin-like protein